MSSEFEVLPLHKELSEFFLPKHYYYNLEKTLQLNANVGYIHLQNNAHDESSWVPLLPDYTVYTSLAGNFFKLSIKRVEDSLQYFWQNFGKDSTFINFLGLTEPTIIEILQKTIHKVFPDRFSYHGQTKKEKGLIRSLKRKSDELEKFCSTEETIVCGIKLEEKGKIINPKFTQALMVMHEKDKSALYNANRNIKRLKIKIAQFQDEKSNLNNKTEILNQKSERIKKSVNDILDEKKLGSTILISTEQYLSLILSHPCNHCNNTDLQNKSYHVSYVGFNITIDVSCQLCGTIDSYSNQSKGINFSHLIAASALASGVNRHAMQTALAVMGITTQSCKQSYHRYQSQMFPTIISKAEESARQALDAAMAHANTKEKKSFVVGFDCSWSHSRNAGQASGEFIYLDDLEGYGHKAVVAFHVVEKSRIITRKGKDSASEEKVVLRKGNFEASSRQMEHAILIALLEQITPILEESDLLLEVCIDGDLDSNKTLTNVPIISEIYADLKHASKNIRKNLLKKQYARYHGFEQHIMRYFNGCVFAAGLRKSNNESNTPTNEELRYIQVEGLIQHLLNNHDLCWKEVCWHKENEELQLQSPTLQSFTKIEIEGFRKMLLTIFRLPIQQSLVTQYRTTYNEAFNRKILRFLDKRIDYWASYKARHALAVIDNNEGLSCMMSTVRETADFSSHDQHNISKFTGERQSELNRSRNIITKRNQERATKYANERQELQGFDFSQELIPYKYKAEERIRANAFYPSFGKLIADFDVIIKCQGCSAFRKKTVTGLCSLCSFYVLAGWWERLLNKNYVPAIKQNLLDSKEVILLAAKQVFGYSHLREGQLEAVEAYLKNKDTFVSIKTGGGKTFCYVICALIFEGITIRELVHLGIPCASIYANTVQSRNEQGKIFEEIALGFTKIIFVTPEKLCLNREFQHFISNMYNTAKVRFVIDEAHCILDYSNFRESWKKLGILKKNWPLAPIMLLTATCTYQDAQDIRTSFGIPSENFAMIRGSSFERKEITIEVYKRKDNRELFSNDLMSLIKMHEGEKTIIYCATQSGCDDLFAILQLLLPDKNIGIYHGGLGDEQRESIMSCWKNGKIQIMIGTNAFGMGINSTNVYLVIHCVAPLNMTNLVQQIGRAGRDGNKAKSIIFYSIKKDLRTNFGILAENRETCVLYNNKNKFIS
ncbi:Sgs1p [Rhizophagus irregularis DAOM 197198w]|uniref:DNA 3'-5' helicase n=1 Tax=Rhizophagus irregularis (strain DAOM 197198w) TaxID=1432141 RepID=A0A015IGW8_RHIIW|nr:Sgs1p [Rhizophagus irregularis DAOM 197198w]